MPTVCLNVEVAAGSPAVASAGMLVEGAAAVAVVPRALLDEAGAVVG